MSIEKINTDEIQTKLCNMLEPSGWRAHLKGFILSSDFKKILDYLVNQSQEGAHFTPKIKQVFRAFTECPYSKLKVIIIGQDPYPHMVGDNTVADGIAFSCSNTKQVQPSLKYIFQEVERQMYPEGGYTWDPDLKRWSNQGVLLLNTALTTTIGKTGTHYRVWQTFIVYVLDYLAWNNPGLIYAFLGKKAQEFMDVMPDNNWKFTASHPASAAHQNAERWNSDNLFKKISYQLKRNNNLEIIW